VKKPAKKPAPARDPVGHPYARISDPEQRKGGGLVRQTEDEETLAKINEFCRLFGFKLSKRFRIDDGVSAWQGLNASPEHELGQFLAEAKRGLIPAGDCLILENYDRLSRQDPWAAIGLVNDLRQLGIHVGRLDRMKLLRCDSTDYGDFFEAAVEFMRGNSESNAKSDRNGSEWRRKRKAARESKAVMTHQLPAWVREENGKLVLIPDRAAVVRRIVDLAADQGLFAIRRLLENEKVPAFGANVVRAKRKRSAFCGRWSVSYLHTILTDRRALGEFQPRGPGGEPDGQPIPDYFPRVVSDEAWKRARRGMEERHRKPGRVTDEVNVFGGLLRDARTGESYAVGKEMGQGKPYRSLRSTAPRSGAGKAYAFSLAAFEGAVLQCLKEIDPHKILNGDDKPDDALTLAADLEAVEAELARASAFMDEHGFSETIGKRITALEDSKRALTDELAEARERADYPLSEKWGEAKTLLAALETAPDKREARLRLRSALRRIVDSIWLLVVPRGRDRLCAVQVWFAGGERRRDYLILNRPPKANARARTGGGSWCWSFAAAALPGDLDLRDPGHAARLEKALEAVDLTTPAADLPGGASAG
jgi:hypothetical protein